MTATIGELCAGYGGIALGVEAVLDARVLWYSEVEDAPNRVLAERFPDAPNLGDMRAVDWHTTPRVDILTGGTPCQDISHAGMRLGMREGTRSNLWTSMRDAIAVLRPRLVIWENVGGIISAEADSALESDTRLLADIRRRDGQPVLRALGRVLGDLASLGYVGGWHSLRAADVGAPHLRLRLFIVAHPQEVAPRWPTRKPLGDVGQASTSALLPTTRTSDYTGKSEHGEGGLDLQSTIAMLPTPTARDFRSTGPSETTRGHAPCLTAIPALLPTPAVNDMGDNKSVDWWDEWAPRQHASDGRHAPHGKSLGVELKRLLPTTTGKDADGSGSTMPRTSTHHSGTTLTDATQRGVEQWGDYADAIALWERLIGRPAPEPTEVSPAGHRRLAPKFSEWMMGLPDGWVTDVEGVSRRAALRALGNGCVPQQVAHVVDFLLDVLTGVPAVELDARKAVRPPSPPRVDPDQMSLLDEGSTA